MKTSVGLGVKLRPASMLSLLCIRSFLCRMSSRGVIVRDCDSPPDIHAVAARAEESCSTGHYGQETFWFFDV